MANHVIIWQGDQTLAENLVNGIAANDYPSMRIVCSNTPEIKYAFNNQPCFDWPVSPSPSSDMNAAWATAWKDSLQNVYLDIARSTAAHVSPDTIVLNLIIPAACSRTSWQTLQHIAAGANMLGVMEFAIHVIVLLDTVSMYGDDQIHLLESFQKDLCAKDTVPPVWNRLSVLSDWSATGSGDPQISRDRQDILAGLIVNTGATLHKEQHDCVTCYVQSTDFGKNDLNMLPRQILYDLIRQQSEATQTSKEVAEKLFPDLTSVANTLYKLLDNKNYPLVTALLADDDNYKSRTSNELVNEFIHHNISGLANSLDVDSEADKWLAAAKHQLATWIHLRDYVRLYIRPNGILDADLDQKITEIRTNKQAYSPIHDPSAANSLSSLLQHIHRPSYRQSPPLLRNMPFGSKISPAKRLNSARKLAEDIKVRIVQFCLIRYLNAIKERLPLLNNYCDHLERDNEEIFGKQSGMLKAYEEYETRLLHHAANVADPNEESDSPVSLRHALMDYELSKLMITQKQTDNYKEYLSESLNANPLPASYLLSDQSFFDTDASRHISAGYLILNKAYISSDNISLQSSPSYDFLGASTRYYRLTTCPWHLESVQIPAGFLNVGVKNDTALPSIEPPRNTSIGWKNMDIALDWTGTDYKLSWTWPDKINVLWLDIMIDDIRSCYHACLHVQPGHRGQHTIGISSLPQGKSVRVCFDDRKDKKGQHAEKTLIVPQISIQLPLLKKTGLGTALNVPPSLWKWSIPLPEVLTPGLPASHCKLALQIENQTFQYPIPPNITEFQLWSKRNETWISAQMTLEDTKDA